MTPPRPPESLLPLTAVAFEILLTLADGDCHGYHIMQDVSRRTNGAVVLHPGTLYRALARLLDESLIEEIDHRPSKSPAGGRDDERRREYRLTRFGRAVLAAEAARLDQQVRQARARRLLGKAQP
jgi:DNA-binding PadR family transcriptional regulator